MQRTGISAVWALRVLLLLLVADRLVLLVNFSSQYTDSDAVMFWHGAWEYAQGIVRGPFLYGQNYNFMLESLFAVPLLWVGVPVNWAMPLVAMAMAAFPFLALARWCWRSSNEWAAVTVVALLLCCVPEYAQITCMAKGYGTGLFVLGFMWPAFFAAPSGKRELWLGALSALAFALSANVALVLAPLWLYRVLKHRKTAPINFVLAVPAGAAVLFAYFLLVHFAPNVVHPAWHLTATFAQWLRVLAHLNEVFYGVGMITYGAEIMLLIGGVAAAVLFWRTQQRPAALATIFGLVGIVLSFSINKMLDGYEWVFFPISRMYLAVPLLLVLVGIKIASTVTIRSRYAPLLLLIPCILVGLRVFAPTILAANVSVSMFGGAPVEVSDTKELATTCAQLQAFSNEHGATLVAALHGSDFGSQRGHMEFITYGCPCLEEEFPPTYYRFDRKYWSRAAVATTAHKTIVVIGGTEAHWNKYAGTANLKQLSSEPLIHLLENIQEPVPDLLLPIDPLQHYRNNP